jgi:hypothetical protein
MDYEDPLGKQFWLEAIKESQVGFDRFFSLLCTRFSSHKTNLSAAKSMIHYCLREKDVTLSTWNDLLKFFGPLDEQLSFIPRMRSVFSLDYFVGYALTNEAENLIKNERSGSFLLRFSTTQATFTFTLLNNNLLKHVR